MNPASLFLRKQRGMVDDLVNHFNKQQKINSLTITACTGEDYPVYGIVAEKLIQAVDRQGPEVLRQIFLNLDKQMDDVLAALNRVAAQSQADSPPAPGEITLTVEGDDEEADDVPVPS